MNNLKVGQKLTGAFAVVALIILVLGVIGIITSSNIMKVTNELSEVRLPAVQALLTINEAQTGLKSAERTLLISSLDKERVRAYKI